MGRSRAQRRDRAEPHEDETTILDMRPETRQKLDALQKSDARWGWIAAAIGVASTMLLWFFWAPAVGEQRVYAVVQSSRITINDDSGQRTLVMEAQLQDGKRVRATSLWLVPPANQSTVILRERVSMIGYRSYAWDGPSRN